MTDREDNVIDFTEYKDFRETPVPSLLEWIKVSIEAANKFEKEQVKVEARKKHNDNVIKSMRIGQPKGEDGA